MTSKTLWLSVVLLIAAIPAAAGPPACTPFNDAGCFFGEAWDDGDSDGWASSDPSAFTNTMPGLGGTSRTAQLRYSGNDGGNWADTGINHSFAAGAVEWFEFRIKYEAGWSWGASQTAPSATWKTFEVNTNGDASCQGRLLMGVLTDNQPSDEGAPEWHIYTNSTCSGGTGQETFGRETTGSAFRFQPNIEYHVVNEVKLAQNTGGYVKTWVNGVLIINAQNIRTVGTGNTWDFIRIGGQYATVTGTGNDVWYDQLRMTATDISPGSVTDTTPPAPPSGLSAR